MRVDVPEPEVGRRRSRRDRARDRPLRQRRDERARRHVDELGVANGDRVEIRLTLDRYYALVADTFADAAPGELILYEDSYGLVTLAISNGDAARLTGVAAGDELRIARA